MRRLAKEMKKTCRKSTFAPLLRLKPEQPVPKLLVRPLIQTALPARQPEARPPGRQIVLAGLLKEVPMSKASLG
jgi:hypothetical protein